MYDLNTVKKVMTAMAEEGAKHVDLLAELDGLSGDGDLGETIGFSTGAVIKCCSEGEYADIADFLKKTAMAMNKAAPSTLGTLLSSGVMALAKACKGKEGLEDADIVMFPTIFADAIKAKGKAERGNKTILDALYPMADAVKAEFDATGNLAAAYRAGAIAAEEGAQATSGMIPRSGRAQWIGERVKDNLDGGAVFCAKVAQLFM